MKYKAYNFTVMGASHKKAKKPCQDASVSINKDDYILTAVCDGHGGEDYFRSDRGSEFAVKAVRRCMNDENIIPMLAFYAEDDVRVNEMLLQLEKSIICEWNELVEKDYAEDPFTEEELENVNPRMRFRYAIGEKIECAYGTTMLVNVITENYWFGIHIGDGECVTVDDEGNFFHPIPHDDNCVFNYTTSICDRTAIYNMRHHFSTTLPKALFIASDGVDNCFATHDRLHDFYSMIMRSFESSGELGAIVELLDYLPTMSKKGSGDDISLGIILGV
ncbi:MAG: PP2C family serine/threonine-protein phosphatase [Acutalibacteraceae bacterium]|nr:protein phosphatase 2C domain-containing protein [Clostridia bacterium]MBQ2604053.1 protein phosphatase 2C domain-containing protein [Clostridia bacterium]MEE3451341.1 PP2C family serine/threonine-protein phosphatase [Acutalibacteraceae bacterium]